MRATIWLFLATLACGAHGEAPAAPQRVATEATPPRGLWVLCEGSERVLERPERIASLIADARALGVSDLFVQVYRGGRAWFPSKLADASPHAKTLLPDGGDALGALIVQAHAAGLRVHAWVNVLSLASNAGAPILAALGRDVVSVDNQGRSLLDYPNFEVPPPDRSYYRMGTPAVWLDPALPAVRERLAATFAELLAAAPSLDGLHLDYIRYPDTLPFSPGTRFGVGLGFGFGAASRARFEAETGLSAPFGGSLANADRFDAWRRGELTRTLARIAEVARAKRPGLRISAAVIADRERAYLVDLQDWLGWLDAGHLDFAVPMLYTRDEVQLRYAVEAYAAFAASRELWVGLGSWLFAGEPARAAAQLRAVQGAPRLGSALFSWDALRETDALREALVEEVSRGRAPLAR